MRTLESSPSCPSKVIASARPMAITRIGVYLELVKPRIVFMVSLIVALGYILGSQGQWYAAALLHTVVAVSLLAMGCSALNQLFERDTDRLMMRTATRPLPEGRMAAREVLALGLVLSASGGIYLLVTTNLLTVLLGAATLALYTFVYTPLKRRTPLCTAIGAIPGAMPPLLGWTAAHGAVDFAGFSLFAILFLWQFPHFFAIGWIYRKQYLNAGLHMVPGGGRFHRLPSVLALTYSLALIPVSVVPRFLGLAGPTYLTCALILSVWYCVFALRFLLFGSDRTARGLLWSSLVYLPAWALVLVWDHLRLLS